MATDRGGSAQIADFLMLQAINRYEPLVAHCGDSGVLHPEDLFRVCVAAAGELSTFTTPSKRPPALRGLPARSAARVVRARSSLALRASLIAVIEQSAIPIPLESKKFGISVALVPDRALYTTAVFILAARADLPSEEYAGGSRRS